jgi:hypothetical protein
MNNSWRKIIELIKKTGDRCLVVDEKSGEAFAIVPIKQYEELIDAKSAVPSAAVEKSASFDQEIAAWQSTKQTENENLVAEEFQAEKDENIDEDFYYIEPV